MDWKELFGSDDDGESDSELTEKQKLLIENENNIVQPTITFDKIPGLKLVQQALNHEQQMYLVNALIDHEYFTDERNQIMLFGELPLEIKWLIPWVKKNYSNLFEPDVFEREPLFDQAILNMYKKGDGILSHVDLLRFEDGVLIVSLLSSCVMKMRPARENATSYTVQDDSDNTNVIDLLLRPGDILSLSNEARYNWEHGIEETLFDKVEGEIIERGTRLSITLRKLIKDPELLTPASIEATARQ